jgi:predicted nucleic acid-binding protein
VTIAPYDDAQIAAIAEAHGVTVVTRNLRHFTPLGVRVFSPWEQSPRPRRATPSVAGPEV